MDPRPDGTNRGERLPYNSITVLTSIKCSLPPSDRFNLWKWMAPARSPLLMEKFHSPTLNCLLKQKISAASARGKIHSRVPQTQRSASSPGLAVGIAMAV